ncbi:hypothetical protein ACP4OV_002761 [Aristida adscensionis]
MRDPCGDVASPWSGRDRAHSDPRKLRSVFNRRSAASDITDCEPQPPRAYLAAELAGRPMQCTCNQRVKLCENLLQVESLSRNLSTSWSLVSVVTSLQSPGLNILASDKHAVELEFEANSSLMETMHGKETFKPASHEDNGKPKVDVFDARPRRREILVVDSHEELVKELLKEENALNTASRLARAIIPDPTPQCMNSGFYSAYRFFWPIVKKDSVRRFLRYFKEDGCGMSWNGIITPETFHHMVVHNALRCAKVALEGQAPELDGHVANPNCMNQYGYFPLHEAAERFSVDMVKLLLNHGALTCLRTAGSQVIEDLLPLHVAVENTCMHKYLEENLFPNVDHPDYPTMVDDNYIYKLIHLLCLPEMKIFLDTTRVLAENTDNLLDEIWNYVADCKVVQTAILLLAAQKHIRGACSCRRNGNSKVNGFTAIINRIHHSTLELVTYQDKEKHQQHQGKIKLMLSTSLLVNIISHAGQAIDAARSEASHVEVLERVSSILKAYGFNPTGEGINIENLCPYKFKLPNGEEFDKDKHGSSVAARVSRDVPHLLDAKKDVRKKLPRGLELNYTWQSFFPYWRSVLACRFRVKVFPSHSRYDRKRMLDIGEIYMPQNSSADKVSIPVPNHTVGVLGRSRSLQPPGMYQPRRQLGTAALTILMKVLRKA